MATKQTITIPEPKIRTAEFSIEGTAPLVIHKFSTKTKKEMKAKMEKGTQVKNKKREPTDMNKLYEEAKYKSPEGWEGFNASSIRCAMIRACKLVGFNMTDAKCSIFVLADGYDHEEREIPLVKIIGKSHKSEMIARVETGQPYVCVRAAYDKWKAKVRIQYDADQFTLTDVSNLLARAGLQVGIGEGRPFSKKSTGMGWGTFKIAGTK